MSKGQPNIILIMSDNQQASTLGCYGNEEAYTPRLDRMAKQGMLFKEAYCPNAFCSPCRASLLTGLMPSQHGVHSWLNERNGWEKGWNSLEGITTLPEILGKAGYRTALCGKYHLGDVSEPQNGFDHWVTMPDGHITSFWRNRIVENSRTYVHEGHTVDLFTDKAIDFMEKHRNAEDPFFLFVPYPAPYGHWPATKENRPTRYHERFEDCPMKSVERVGLNQKTVEAYVLQRSRSTKALNFDMLLMAPNDLPTLRNYYAQVSMIDENVGRLLDAVDAQGIGEETLIIFTADHGLSLGQHGVWGHGSSCFPSSMYNACHSVPLIMRHKGRIKAGSRSELHVSNHDLFSTILDYAGIGAGAAQPQVSSRSLTGIMSGEPVPGAWVDAVFSEQEESRIVRTPDWLYFQRFKGSEGYPLKDELYDLHSDPNERVNCIGEPAHADTVGKLGRMIKEFFDKYTVPEYDLWRGGTSKDNTMRPWLWKDAWGDDWDVVR